jgi:copper(I)-binding protein
MAKAQSGNGEVTDDEKAQMKKIAATNLISQELLELEAHSLHIVATPAEVDSMLQYFKSRFPDEATFEKTLKEAGDTPTNIRLKLAKEIRANKVLARQLQTPKPAKQEMGE